MDRIVIYTYDPTSEGGDELRKAITKHTDAAVDWRGPDQSVSVLPNGTIICWGRVKPPTTPIPFSAKVLNSWFSNAIKVNKLRAFIKMFDAGVPTVPFTEFPDVANEWLKAGRTVVCRHKVGSQDSQGIEVVVPKFRFFGAMDAKVPDCKLYTQYIPDAREFRVHCTPLYFIDGLEKKKLPTGDKHIFHQDHGLFCRDGVLIPQAAINAAKQAVKACGLDFGAVDLLWVGGKPYLLEVNTAPGLLPSEANNYAKAFIKHGYI